MEPNNICVSVIMLAYNHGKYIRQALDSVFMQKTNFEFEVIVGEDCSPHPDQSREILLEYKKIYGDRLILVLHEKNVGASRNGTILRQMAKGKYQASLECDDYWIDENKLQRQYDFLESHPEYSACGSDNCAVDDDGNIVISKQLMLKKDRKFTIRNYQRDGFTVHGNTLLRRAEFFPVNDPKYIELRKSCTTMGDIINFSILYSSGPIYVFKDVMLAHRDGSKISSSFSASQKNKMIFYSYMQMNIAKALETYYDGTKDFSFIVVNRLAEVTITYLFFKKQINIDKAELKKLYSDNSQDIRTRAYIQTVRQLFRRCVLKVKHGLQR